MRKFFYAASAAALVSAAAVGFVATSGSADTASGTPTTQSFAFTGANQTFVVPTGVTTISVDALGAQGGAGSTCIDNSQAPPDQVCGAGGTGGTGAHVTSTLAVTPGETLTIVVGGQGGDATPSDLPNECAPPAGNGTPGEGGFGGGGSGGAGGCPAGAGGGGGGATAILRGTTPILVAGGGAGGGGAGNSIEGASDGGNGGNAGLLGGDGTDGICPGLGGHGATTAIDGVGGAGGSGCTEAAGPSSSTAWPDVHAAAVVQCPEGPVPDTDGGDGGDGGLIFGNGGNGGDGALSYDIMGAGGGGGGGGLFAGGGGGGGGANCHFVAASAGGGGGGSSLGDTVVEGASSGNGSLVLHYLAPAAAPAAIEIAPKFTG